MNLSWKDFLEKRAQLFPGQGYDSKGHVTLPGAKSIHKIPKYDIKTDPKYSRAYSFYRDIAPSIRMRELGVSKLPEHEERAFREIQEVPVFQNATDIGRSTGRYYQENIIPQRLERKDFLDDLNIFGHLFGDYSPTIRPESIKLAPTANARTLVHELRHALANRVRLGDKGILNGVYAFEGKDIRGPKDSDGDGYSKKYGVEEMFTTNKEHQFRIYEKLYDELGRAPTVSEYFNAAGDDRYIDDSFSTPVNLYEQRVNKDRFKSMIKYNREFWKKRKDLIRKAMQRVSMRGAGAGQYGWRNFV